MGGGQSLLSLFEEAVSLLVNVIRSVVLGVTVRTESASIITQSPLGIFGARVSSATQRRFRVVSVTGCHPVVTRACFAARVTRAASTVVQSHKEFW